MALNTSGSQANPLKAKTIGLSDTIQTDGHSYTTLLTVLANQTLKIDDGMVGITYKETGGVNIANLSFFITISGKRLPLLCEKIDASAVGTFLINLKSIITTGITLATGDTIKLECVYSGSGTVSGGVNATFLINDYQI